MNKQKKSAVRKGIEWLPVIGYEGLYEVSSGGEVRSLPRRTTIGKAMAPQLNNSGYFRVNLTRNAQSKYLYIHHLVARAFLGERPSGYDINHINGIKTDNAVVNLEYVTRSDNMKHARKMLLHNNYADGHYNAKLNSDQVFEMLFAYNYCGLSDEMYSVWAESFGVDIQTIKDVVAGRTWRYIHEQAIQNNW